jgi:hypothetical protein
MADNTTITNSTGGIETVALDEVVYGGLTIKVERVKLGFGADGAYEDISDTNALPQRGAAPVATVGTIDSATKVVGPVAVGGMGAVMVSIAGAGYGALSSVFEISHDGGTTWFPTVGALIDTAFSWGLETGAGNITAINRLWMVNVTGASHFRWRTTAAAATLNAVVRITPTSLAVPPFLTTNISNAQTKYGDPVGNEGGLITRTMLRSADRAQSNASAAGAALTLTLPAVPGMYHYLTEIGLTLYSAAARTGAVAPATVTTTNLPGALAFAFSTGAAIGTNEAQAYTPAVPLKASAAGVDTTIVCAATAGGIWRARCTYYCGS